MTTRAPHAAVHFEPTRPASRPRLMWAFALAALLWPGTGFLVVHLLGHTHILLRLLLVTAMSCALFTLALVWAMVLRAREEVRSREESWSQREGEWGGGEEHHVIR